MVAFDIRQSQVDATLERISRLQGAFDKYGENFDAMTYLEHEMFFEFRHPKKIVAEARQELLSEIEENNGDAVESDNEDDISAALGDAAALEDSTDQHEWNSLKDLVTLWWNFSKRADPSQGDVPPGSQKWVEPTAEAERIRDRLGLGLPTDEWNRLVRRCKYVTEWAQSEQGQQWNGRAPSGSSTSSPSGRISSSSSPSSSSNAPATSTPDGNNSPAPTTSGGSSSSSSDSISSSSSPSSSSTAPATSTPGGSSPSPDSSSNPTVGDDEVHVIEPSHRPAPNDASHKLAKQRDKAKARPGGSTGSSGGTRTRRPRTAKAATVTASGNPGGTKLPANKRQRRG